MIVKTKNFGGVCSCGHTHNATTEFCIIEKGCINKLEDYAKQYGLIGFSTAVYDQNTYNAAGMVRSKVSQEIVLNPQGLHADEHGVQAVLDRLADECKFLIALGSGTVHDITRYCAYKKGIPFISCPTAASVDGFCSSVAAMTWEGHKKTLTAVAPKIVVADIDIISKAPFRLAKSGFGDMVGKFIALADWKIANTLTGEYFCDRIYDITLNATKAVMDNAQALKDRSEDAYEKLTYGLLMSGLAMQLLGNSRCASGAEHHISHLIEMTLDSNALHGEKVGVGTLFACEEYHRLKADCKKFSDYPDIEVTEINDVFGSELADAIIEENRNDVCKGITAKQINTHINEIYEIIDQIPTKEELLNIYSALEIKSTLTDIDVDEALKQRLLDCSPLVRNRLTLMRLRRSIKK